MASKLSRIFYKDTVIALMRCGENFFLRLTYADQPISASDVLEKWPEAESIRSLIKSSFDSEREIPLSELEYVLQVLHETQARCSNLKKLIFYIQADVENVHFCESPPPGFLLRYTWSDTGLSCILPSNTIVLRDGWYRIGNDYWKYVSLGAQETERLRRSTVKPDDLVSFLTKDLPLYTKAGVRIECPIRYETEHALELWFEKVEADTVEIKTVWHVPPNSIDESVTLEAHVLADHVVYPGITPTALSQILPNIEGVSLLTGTEIADFRERYYEALKPWIVSDCTRFEDVHKWIEPPYEWTLAADAKPTRGVGKAFAYPMACVGGERFSPEALRALMTQAYARLQKGWVRRGDLCTLGMDAKCCWMGGKPIIPIALDASQLLCRGDNRIAGPWQRMTLESEPWQTSKTKQAAAQEHLRFLLHWGISGGISGGFEAAVAYGPDMLRRLFVTAPEARVLIAGHAADLKAFRDAVRDIRFAPVEQYDARQKSVVYTTRFGKIGSALEGIKWDILILLEPDELYETPASMSSSKLLSIHAECTIAFFLYDADNCPDRYRPWQSMLIRCANPELSRCLIRNVRHPSGLPEPYTFAAQIVERAEETGFSVVMTGSPDTGVPIPPRAPKTHPPVPTESIIVTAHSDARTDFFSEARRLADYRVVAAEPVPFFCYLPTYDRMDAAQRKWYFFLRTQILENRYPDTDLSYLFVYIYELLACIGCSSPEQAFTRLLDVWKAYRDRHPGLDKYLAEWVFDFINVYPCGITEATLWSEAPAYCGAELDVHLTQLSKDEPLLLRPDALEMLSDYRFRKSKFYLAGHSETMDLTLPKVVALVDARLRETNGVGLLGNTLSRQNHIRTAFSSAVVEKTLTYTITGFPYTQDAALRQRLAQVLRYAENVLRGLFDFSSKLRGIDLRAPISEWIDTYLKKQFTQTSEKPKKASITLSQESLERLRHESDEVRAALIASMDAGGEAPAAADDAPLRPADTPEGLLTDLAPVYRILKAVDSAQRRLLDSLAQHQWESTQADLKQTLPDILQEAETDAINRLSIAQLGTNLIEREADKWVVAEDYRDELAFLLRTKDEPDESVWTVTISGLDKEWATFFEKADLTVLGALLEGGDALAECAQRRETMPDLLIDEVNEAAMDTVGDLVASADGLSEDYRALIETHLRRR